MRCKVEPRLEATAPVLLPVSAGVKSLRAFIKQGHKQRFMFCFCFSLFFPKEGEDLELGTKDTASFQAAFQPGHAEPNHRRARAGQARIHRRPLERPMAGEK